MSKRPGEVNGVQQMPGKLPRLDQGVLAAALSAGACTAASPRLPMLMYKDGEPLRDLRSYYSKDGASQSVEVRIPAHCLTSNNRHVRARQLWGSDVYTEDSDLVAVLMHCGYWYHSLTHPPAQVAEVRAVLTPQAPLERYPSTARNSIRSRAWAAPVEGCSYRVDKCWVVTRSGTSVDLAPNLEGVPAAAPTFTPTHMERIVTRSAVGGAGRQRQVQEVTVMFNLVNEPWPKYNAAAVADRGLRPHEWTSARLHSAVMYLESHRERFELAHLPAAGGAAGGNEADGEAAGGAAAERYRFSRCSRALPAAVMQKLGLPLPEGERTVLHDDLGWEEIEWGISGVSMRGQLYPLVRIHFIPLTAKTAAGGGQ
ncbi:hypothetical protein CHLNCDRAFT_143678 [Chlorella variabilis]|uniref:Uncharacterized protein n=1 Tax=Chlorella variabilis TaxID=554065 RepID=E1ZA82_CHLVA|nr:hypothetical protein CHLNCDRAFT_143678 [Chlorella variabilis]EFN57219.1 hypothetical protein CHLNCDRAFT_143678 [Chlorella variabilis]|eukprot:XP_005849321.1 hypothetical protein CHLNCDRAFT_143678 [Chlorella variabilis]